MNRSDITDLPAARRAFDAWFRQAALPLWSSSGRMPDGGFYDALTLDGAPVPTRHRARVQARQVFVYATAAIQGYGERWLPVAREGFALFRDHYQRDDGLFAVLTDGAGRVLDATPCLYEQAFSLLAMAALHGAGSQDFDHPAEALRLLDALEPRRIAAGGYRELTEHPYQANSHMHLLEAALAWDELGVSARWTALADEIVGLAMTYFIDPDGGFLREFFDESWRPAVGDPGRCVEPGHQFEWAWLLERWGVARGDARARAAARRLYENGLAGVDRTRDVAVNALWDDFTLQDGTARLWPQTEHLKAALVLGNEDEATAAAAGLAQYLDVPTPGAWRDRMLPDGGFIEEPAPASSFYHLTLAVLELARGS